MMKNSNLVPSQQELRVATVSTLSWQAAGGVFSAGALFPLEVIKTNLQAHTKKKKSPSSSPPMGEEEPGMGAEEDRAAKMTPSGSEEEREERQRSLLARRDREHTTLEETSPSVASVAKDIYSREGIAGFYRGKV